MANKIWPVFWKKALEEVEKAGICENFEVQFTASQRAALTVKDGIRVVRSCSVRITGLITVIREA